MTAMTASITPGQELYGKVAAVTGARIRHWLLPAPRPWLTLARAWCSSTATNGALARACAAIGEGPATGA